MKMLLFLAADYANITRDGKLNVMGIFNEIYAPAFPVRHSSMHLIAILAAELGEFGETRDLFVKMMDENGKQLLELSGRIDFPTPAGGKTPKANVILEIRDLIFQTPGTYQFVLLVDKEFIGAIPIYVNKLENAPIN